MTPNPPYRNTAIRTIVRSLGTPMQFAKAQEQCEDNGISLEEDEYLEIYTAIFPDDKEAKRKYLLGVRVDDPEDEIEKPTKLESTMNKELSNVQKGAKIKEILKRIGPGKTYRQALPEFKKEGISVSPGTYSRNYNLLFGNGSLPKAKAKPTGQQQPRPVEEPVAAQAEVDNRPQQQASLAASALDGILLARNWAGGWDELQELIGVLKRMA